VFSDITYGEEQLAFRVRNDRPIAFAPPNGNYGQAATNDRRIPRQLLARLQQILDDLEEGLPPILLSAGRQFLAGRPQARPEILRFLPRVIDDLNAREALGVVRPAPRGVVRRLQVDGRYGIPAGTVARE
jgi:hypothetical protein